MRSTRRRPRPAACRMAGSGERPCSRHTRRRNPRQGLSDLLELLSPLVLVASSVGLVLGWLGFFGGSSGRVIAVSLATLVIVMIASAPGAGRGDPRSDIRRMRR